MPRHSLIWIFPFSQLGSSIKRIKDFSRRLNPEAYLFAFCYGCSREGLKSSTITILMTCIMVKGGSQTTWEEDAESTSPSTPPCTLLSSPSRTAITKLPC